MTRMIYCVDSSTLIAAWNERYPIAHFPSFWGSLDGLIRADRLLSPDEVRREVSKKDEGLREWLAQRLQMFIELEEDIQEEARQILAQFPLLTKQLPGRTAADSFVIAMAKARNFTVVTEEGGGSVKRPTIPFVCTGCGIPCTNLLGLIRGEQWVL
jgi:hypothetical protein